MNFRSYDSLLTWSFARKNIRVGFDDLVKNLKITKKNWKLTLAAEMRDIYDPFYTRHDLLLKNQGEFRYSSWEMIAVSNLQQCLVSELVNNSK